MDTGTTRPKAGGPNGPLARLEIFDTDDGLRGRDYADPDPGSLPLHWRARYRRDDHDGISYSVRSQGTPIAWLRDDGVLVFPQVRYSPATTRHQYLCWAWLATAAPTPPTKVVTR